MTHINFFNDLLKMAVVIINYKSTLPKNGCVIFTTSSTTSLRLFVWAFCTWNFLLEFKVPTFFYIFVSVFKPFAKSNSWIARPIWCHWINIFFRNFFSLFISLPMTLSVILDKIQLFLPIMIWFITISKCWKMSRLYFL